MPIRYRIDKKFLSFLNNNLADFKRESSIAISKYGKREILGLLKIGTSPTQGGKWKETYSKRYELEIIAGKRGAKTISPVNLKLTGKLYSSLSTKSKQPKDAAVTTFSFKDAKKARKHDQGRRGMPVRRLLPNSRESFHTNINLAIVRVLEKTLRKYAKKASD